MESIWKKMREWMRRNIRKDLKELQVQMDLMRRDILMLREEITVLLTSRTTKPESRSLRDCLSRPGVQSPPSSRPDKERGTIQVPFPPEFPGPKLGEHVTLYANPKVPVSPEGGGTDIVRGEFGTPIQQNVSPNHFAPDQWYGRCDPHSQRKIDTVGVSQPLPIRLVGGPCDGQNYCGPPSGLCPDRLMMLQLVPMENDIHVKKAALFSYLSGPQSVEAWREYDWPNPEDRRTIYTYDRLATDEEIMVMNRGQRIAWEEEADAV